MTKVLIERHASVTVVTINRVERRNAVDAETAGLLREVFAAFEADENARVAVLTGAGGAFCSGYDLHSVAEAPPPYDPDGPGPMGPTRAVGLFTRRPRLAGSFFDQLSALRPPLRVRLLLSGSSVSRLGQLTRRTTYPRSPLRIGARC